MSTSRSTEVFILRGGVAGWLDGWLTSRGMDQLAARIKRELALPVTIYHWTSWGMCLQDMRHAGPDVQKVLIGYSGGGSRATWIAEYRIIIHLLVAYDPSPIVSMAPLGGNVRKAICYFNDPRMLSDIAGGLGGGQLHGPPGVVQRVNISEPHLEVQFDSRLHDRTIAAIKGL